MISYKRIMSLWDNFFFKPQSSDSIALFRIVWGLFLFVYFVFNFNNVVDFYGPDAIISFETVKNHYNSPRLNLFFYLPETYGSVYLVMSLFGISIIGTILGFYTRTSLILALICLSSFHHRNIWVLSSAEVLIRTISILLICSSCGNSLAIDSYLRSKRGIAKKMTAPWALRLIQIQISVVYVWTVWHKLKGNDWIDGTAVYLPDMKT